MSWAFRCFLRESQRSVDGGVGNDVVDEWIAEKKDDAFEAALDSRLKYLSQQPRVEWKLPYFHLLKGACAGLGEIRFVHRKVQQRLIGANTDEGEYTWLIAAIEKNWVFHPKDACATANKRLAEVRKSRSAAHACDRD